MKVFVIITIGIWIFSNTVQFLLFIKNNEHIASKFIGNIIGLVIAILSLVFVCVGW